MKQKNISGKAYRAVAKIRANGQGTQKKLYRVHLWVVMLMAIVAVIISLMWGECKCWLDIATTPIRAQLEVPDGW